MVDAFQPWLDGSTILPYSDSKTQSAISTSVLPSDLAVILVKASDKASADTRAETYFEDIFDTLTMKPCETRSVAVFELNYNKAVDLDNDA